MRVARQINAATFLKLLFFLVLFQHRSLSAQSVIAQTSTSSAMGGAGRASLEPIDSFFLNPATVAVTPGLNAGFLYRDGGPQEDERESSFAIGMTENNAENFAPGGFAYAQRRRRIPQLGFVNERYGYAAFAKTISGRLALGLGLSWSEHALVGVDRWTLWRGNAGLLWALTPQLGLAAGVSHFGERPRSMPLQAGLLANYWVGAHWVIPDVARFAFDAVQLMDENPQRRNSHNLGVELRHGGFLVTRLGYQVDDFMGRNSATLGLGFDGPRLRANYAFQRPVSGRGQNEALHSVDLILPF